MGKSIPLLATATSNSNASGYPMDSFAVLLQPLILISGVALLILSTAARFSEIEVQIDIDSARRDAKAAARLRRLFARATRFRIALMTLYSAAVMLTASSVGGGLLFAFDMRPDLYVMATTCLAAFLVLLATATLLSECRLSLETLKHELHRDRAAERD